MPLDCPSVWVFLPPKWGDRRRLVIRMIMKRSCGSLGKGSWGSAPAMWVCVGAFSCYSCHFVQQYSRVEARVTLRWVGGCIYPLHLSFLHSPPSLFSAEVQKVLTVSTYYDFLKVHRYIDIGGDWSWKTSGKFDFLYELFCHFDLLS